MELILLLRKLLKYYWMNYIKKNRKMLNYKLFINENMVNDLKNKYVDKGLIDIGIFNTFSKKKSYLQWLIKTFLNTSDEKIETVTANGAKFEDFLIKIIDKYDNIKVKLKGDDKKINRYNNLTI